ncbi:Scarecrow-like protein 27 [Raphanus sativus]|uniref:Scarecrow-like protein 27 n=1 Tax=Raphanus sativus TaxID=3726 RepID=A0A6J0MXS9_RAPSA|nr:scarecrow-like protein 27 [Raphanus sativus]KAJ4867883.1 Scarecrow-like protein 27 [Raphanus sativus]
MPLSFEKFQGEGVFGVSSYYTDSHKIRFNQNKTGTEEEEDLGYVFRGGLQEPTSVLDALRSPSPLASHSSTTTNTTLSSSHGGGAVTATAIAGDDKCSQMGLDDLDGVLSASSPSQEQSILRLIMDPGSGFGVLDPGFGFGSGSAPVTDGSNQLLPCSFPFHDQTQTHQIANPEALFSNPPPAKRFNSGSHQPVFPFSDPVQLYQFPVQFHQQRIPSSAAALAPVPPPGIAVDDQSVIIEQLFNAAELIATTGDHHTILAQGILARLNHHLSTSFNNNNKNPPFQRAASHISEALLSLGAPTQPLLTPENLILRIAAYRAFSETSPFLQFVNFTANQSILDLGFDRIHIIDFDVGYGGQWSSLMQELARNRGSSLKVTVFAPPPSTVSDEFELRFTEENLRSFAGELKIPFEMDLLSLELLLNPAYWPLSLRSSEKEAVAVNLPISSVVPGYLPLILRFLKQISPNVVVCYDRGCDRNDAPFPNAVIHALQYHTTLLESLDANQSQEDSSVERFWVQPSIEKLLMKRHRWIERSPPWRSLFTQCGFTPASLSQTAETQAECLMQRNPVRGFHVEKRQSSLVMCWQRKELVSVSAWNC